jgi:hypothetical protein
MTIEEQKQIPPLRYGMTSNRGNDRDSEPSAQNDEQRKIRGFWLRQNDVQRKMQGFFPFDFAQGQNDNSFLSTAIVKLL